MVDKRPNAEDSEVNELMDVIKKASNNMVLIILKAAHPVPDGEMFMLSVRCSFMHRRALCPVPIRYACQFISFFQYIVIRVRQAKLRHYGYCLGLGVILVIFLFFITTDFYRARDPCQYQLLTPCDYGIVAKWLGCRAVV